MNIKLNAKLCAYTKGIIPDVSNFITEAPQDNILYGRRNKNWVKIEEYLDNKIIQVEEGSGLDLIDLPDNIHQKLSIRQWVGKESQLPILEDDKTYYTSEDIIELYLDGGTAYSTLGVSDLSENLVYNSYGNCLSNTSNYNINLISINSKGEAI